MKKQKANKHLLETVRNGVNIRLVNLYLMHGADVNTRDRVLGRTAFMWACQKTSDPNAIKMLIKHGANVNARDKYGDTALIKAAEYAAHPDVLLALLNAGAKVNAKNRRGFTPLMYACYVNRNPAMAQTLIGYGADVNMTDNDGLTAFAWACHNPRSQDIKKILLDNGAVQYHPKPRGIMWRCKTLLKKWLKKDQKGKYSVYLLSFVGDKYYAHYGITTDLHRRKMEHRSHCFKNNKEGNTEMCRAIKAAGVTKNDFWQRVSMTVQLDKVSYTEAKAYKESLQQRNINNA